MISTRKKSCSACVAGKRRCDLDLPSCGRCRKARKDCVYPWMMAVGGSEQDLGVVSPPTSVGADLTQDMSRIWRAGMDTSSGSSSGSSTSGGPGAASAYLSPDPLLTTVSPPLVPCLLSQLDEYMLQNQDQAFLSLRPGLGPTDSLSPGRPSATDSAASPEFVYFDITNTPVTTGSVFQSRTEWAAGRFAMQPQVLAMTGQNCFVHHTQLASSEVLQEALAASALHCMRNTANASLVRGEVAKRVARLVGSIRHAVTCASEAAVGRTAPDLLPALQALVVYQCIRFFSRDDVGERMRAERDEAIVQSLLVALYPRLRSFTDTMDGWSAWIYYESMRRTVLTAEILSGTYNFLKQGWDQAEARTLQLKFTAQAALWEARTAVEWEAMWARGPRLQVTVRTFPEDAQGALPEDMEDLGMVLWALHHGLEEMEGWMGKRRPLLVRWGLRKEG